MIHFTNKYPWSIKALAGFVFAITLNGCVFLPRSSSEVVRQAELEQFYQKWQGAQYRFGGTTQEFIDCSALMVQVYSDVYDTHLPRTTEEQARLGKRVALKNLKTGDLVFFKTGFDQRHVGLYIDHGFFLHASKSAGVTRSRLHSDYWAERYWKAKRIIN